MKMLQGSFDQIQGKVEDLLKTREIVTLQALELLISDPFQAKELVRVTATTLHVFNFENLTWEPQVTKHPGIGRCK